MGLDPQTNPGATLEYILKEHSKKFPRIFMVFPNDKWLVLLVKDYRERYELTGSLDYINKSLWYGVYDSKQKLLAAIGFQAQTAQGLNFLYICDLVRVAGTHGDRALVKLVEFTETLPCRLRGLVLTSNPLMQKFVTNRSRRKRKRGWRELAVLVESVPV